MEKHALIPSIYIILKKNDKILMSKRQNTGYGDGQYITPAGHVKPGETFSRAASREAFEEVGSVIKHENLRICHIMQRKSFDSERIDVFFETDQPDDMQIINNEPHKCQTLTWMSMDEIMASNTLSFIKNALQCIQEGHFYSEFDYDGIKPGIKVC